jgi:hypothetical protein
MNTKIVIASVLDGIENVPQAEKDRIEEYLEHNEWGIAFETLCSVIEMNRLDISSYLYEQIAKLGTQMGIDPILWTSFSKQNNTNPESFGKDT